MTIPGVEWTAARTAVLAVTTTCPACSASVGFFRTLAERIEQTRDLRLVVVSAQGTHGVSQWLQENGVKSQKVVQVDALPSIGIDMVPALILVNRGGRVTDIALGTLTRPQQENALGRLSPDSQAPSLDNTHYQPEIRQAELAAFNGGAQLLDIRTRQSYLQVHRMAAVNIPLDELDSRALVELDEARPVIVICYSPRCRSAGRSLASLGFSQVFLLAP
jgi:rhodanese-related sulfurtransferase